MIKAKISGNRGEAKAFRTLGFIRSKNIVLNNVELSSGDLRTELDAVVITPGTVTIVEVKNTAKNIFIDENGDFYRTGEFLKWDCNIAEKMTMKEELLRKVLLADGIDDALIRRIEVQNKYSRIRTCFVSQLAYVIDGLKYSRTMMEDEMEHIEELIKSAASNEAYPFEFDVVQYKLDFATVMSILEEASVKSGEAEDKEVIEKEESKPNYLENCFASRFLGYVGSAVAAATVMFITTAAVKTIRKGGVF